MQTTSYLHVLFIYASFGVSNSLNGEGKTPIVTCADLNRISYCSSCFNVTECNMGIDGETIACDISSQVCFQDNMGSFCGEPRFVPECQCDVPSGTGKVDFYDPRSYYYCFEDDLIIPGECAYGEVFNADISSCEKIYQSTPFSPQATIECPEDEMKFIALDCTRYQECVLGYSEVYECENGDIYNNLTNKCELYVPFTCTGKENDIYPDSVKCDVSKVCEGGILVSSIPCAEGTVFDPVNKTCTLDQGACQLSGCFIPIPEYVTCSFGNETYQINSDSYYECTLTAQGTFEIIPRECDEGFYFDSDDGDCKNYQIS